MCDEESQDIGELVPDETPVYRGCSRKNFLTQSKDAVQPEAFQKDGKNHKDGLSVALDIVDSVRHLTKNHGAIVILVGDIRALNRGLEVRFDSKDLRHAIIRNMPCMDREPEERVEAESLAAELAYIAKVASAARVVVPPEIIGDLAASAEE
jgi:type IV secretory pathway VirJ component